jgi:hypothetical protein
MATAKVSIILRNIQILGLHVFAAHVCHTCIYVNTHESIFRDYYYHFHGDNGEILFLITNRNRYEIDVLLLVLFRHTLIYLQS